MEEMMPHHCTGCGEMHGGETRESAEVAIARINREADVEIARIQRGETKLAVDGAIEATTIETEGAVDEAVVKAEVLDEILSPPEPEPEPVVVVADETVTEPAEEIPDGEPPEPEPVSIPQKSSNPWWK